MNGSCDWSRVALALIVVLMFLGTPYLWAQTLGTAPVFNTAVPGQTGAQPEGAFKNFVNWIGNVVAPIGLEAPSSELLWPLCRAEPSDDGCLLQPCCSQFPASLV
jgi:hypothetical protein